MRKDKTEVNDSRRGANLCNKLLEFCDGLVQISSDTDWSGDGLTTQIHNMNLHHHLWEKPETHQKSVNLLGGLTTHSSAFVMILVFMQVTACVIEIRPYFVPIFTKVWFNSSRLLTSRFVWLKHLVRPPGLKKQIEHVRRLDTTQQKTHWCVLLTFIRALQVLMELIILYQTTTVKSD